MSEYINKDDALDILDQLEDAIENGELGFYSQAREMMCGLLSEEIIHCEDCKFFEWLLTSNCHKIGYCSRYSFIVNESEFCSKAINKILK